METLNIRSILCYAVTCLVFQFISPHVGLAEETVFKHELTIIAIEGAPIPWLPAVGETLDARITISDDELECAPRCPWCRDGSCLFRIRLRTVENRKVYGIGFWNGVLGGSCGLTKMSGVWSPPIPGIQSFSAEWEWGCHAACEGPDPSFCCKGDHTRAWWWFYGPPGGSAKYSAVGTMKSDDEDCDND